MSGTAESTFFSLCFYIFQNLINGLFKINEIITITAMKLSDLGEFGLIERFSGQFLKGLQPGIVGIGDDAAVIRQDEENSLLVTTDMLIEDTHFLRSAIPPADLGHKALAVNLSDIAGMGGKPTYVFLSLGLPPDLEVAWVDRFFTGLRTLAEQHAVRLLGGDTTKSLAGVVVNITALGTIANRHIKLRSAARPGDVVCVTGMLGDSGTGLRLLLEQKPRDADAEILISRHHRPAPHVGEGQWLGGRPDVHAMMDVSDGIDSDLKRIIEKSGCGMDIDLGRLPLSDELKRVCRTHQWDAPELAVAGGEDYCLLLTVSAAEYTALAADFNEAFGRPLAAIGEVTANAEILRYLAHGTPHLFDHRGWDHFKGGKKT
jgi:thiamine-monophosphate kinase